MHKRRKARMNRKEMEIDIEKERENAAKKEKKVIGAVFRLIDRISKQITCENIYLCKFTFIAIVIAFYAIIKVFSIN